MRVHLKGVHTVRSGSKAYHYAWRGGPRLVGEPGTPDFMASYNAALQARKQPAEGTMFTLVSEYRRSAEFSRLAPGSQKDYRRYLALIENKFGRMPLEVLNDPRVRGDFKEWRDSLSDRPRTADMAWAVLARVLSVALDRGKIRLNPCLKPGRLHKANRAENVWTQEMIDRASAAFPEHLRWALQLALWTGQRQGDLLRLTWAAIDENANQIVVHQRKKNRVVRIPIQTTLAGILERIPKRCLTILSTSEHNPWTSDGFRASWAKACSKAKIRGVTFHDLRGTAVTRLSLSGATDAEIATITGHSRADVGRMMDVYGARDPALAISAMTKREEGEARTKSVKEGVKRSVGVA